MSTFRLPLKHEAKSVNASNPSKPNSEPPRATDSTRSQNQGFDTWSSPTMLSASEIESLREETRRDSVRLKELIAASKLNAPKG